MEPEEQEIIQIRDAIGSLPLMDDVYLRMQAMNIDMIDSYLMDMEHELLHGYMETDKAPMETVFVSALSQLWIMGLYELLRTWRQRVRDIIKFTEKISALNSSARDTYIEEKRGEIRKSVALEDADELYWAPYKRIIENSDYVEDILYAFDKSEGLFRRIGALRMSLAKHELPGQPDKIAMAPGFGRIDMTDGSIYWQIILKDNEVDLISRRTIADMCRALVEDRTHRILPRNIQDKVLKFPKHSFFSKLITVILKDGTEYPKVMIAWSKEVVAVLGADEIPFDARDIADVRYDEPVEE